MVYTLRVFINAEGNPTYEAKDVGLLKLKFDTYKPDRSVFVTDHEQGPYFQVVVAAAGKIVPEWKEKNRSLGPWTHAVQRPAHVFTFGRRATS